MPHRWLSSCSDCCWSPIQRWDDSLFLGRFRLMLMLIVPLKFLQIVIKTLMSNGGRQHSKIYQTLALVWKMRGCLQCRGKGNNISNEEDEEQTLNIYRTYHMPTSLNPQRLPRSWVFSFFTICVMKHLLEKKGTSTTQWKEKTHLMTDEWGTLTEHLK